MEKPQEGDVAARIDGSSATWAALSAVLCAVQPSFAQHPSFPGEDKQGWTLEQIQFRMSTLDQRGKGFQSQASVANEAGSENTIVFQPMVRLVLHQSDNIQHDIVLPVDIISAASPDAVDVIAGASRVQESAGVDTQTRYHATENLRFMVRYGFSIEENLGSIFGGFQSQHDFADDNTTVSFSGNVIHDFFANYRRDGTRFPGKVRRNTFNANVTFRQLLSPTTIVSGSYGATYQRGFLASSFNSAPIDGGGRYKEKFPNDRLRHALGVGIAQHVPVTRTTIKGRYRLYYDDFSITGHTANLEAYQYLGNHFLALGSYRFHRQSHASFYADSFPRNLPPDQPRTSDSDLDQFIANEIGAKLSYYTAPPQQTWSSNHEIHVGYRYYTRTNGLRIHIVSFGYGKTF